MWKGSFSISMQNWDHLLKDKVILLGITIDNKLPFEALIENLCKRASYKLYVLPRMRKFLTVIQDKILGFSFVNSQFNYCAMKWCSTVKRRKLDWKKSVKPTRIFLQTMMKLVFMRTIYSFKRLKYLSHPVNYTCSLCGGFSRIL